MPLRLTALLGWLLSCALAGTIRAETLSFTVPADTPTGVRAAVGIPCASGPAAATIRVRGLAQDALTAQYVPDLGIDGKPAPRGMLWLAAAFEPSQLGKTLTLTLEKIDPPAAPTMRYKDVPKQATEIYERDRLVLRFNHGPEGGYERRPGDWITGYVHPIHGLDGEMISDCAPGDHLHHRGLFWSWVRLRRNNADRGDWWTLRDTRYHFDRILRCESGPVLATITTQGFWDYKPANANAPDRVVREVATLRVFPAIGDQQTLEVDVELYGVGEGVTLAGQSDRNKGYGGFTLRFSKTPQVDMTVDGKKLKEDGLMYRARWADYAGFFSPANRKAMSGAAIFTSPTHPDAPPGWCLRHYGVLNPSYPGLEFVPLPPDRPLTFQYRVILHRGTAEQVKLAELYKLYATPWATSPSSQAAK